MNQKTSLYHKVAKGGFWIAVLRITQQGLELGKLVVLARFLTPHDFGLLGIALLTRSVLETFSQVGFEQALVQKKENIESYLNAAWTISIVRGLILFLIIFFAAPYIAKFFETESAELVIQAIGLSILFQSFTNIGTVYFKKELEFDKEFIYNFSIKLVDFIVAVSAALIFGNVWALVLGLLAGNAVGCIVSYLIHPYRPHLNFDRQKIKGLWGFGRWIWGSKIVVFFVNEGDDILLGKILGATTLGFYQVAFRISNIPATQITHVISQLSFPAYSKLQDNIPKLREAYLKVFQVTTFISFFVAGLIFVLASDITQLFLGEKWMPIVPIMQILAVGGLIRSIGACTGSLFQGVGKPNIALATQVIRLILFAIVIYPLTIKWGMVGTSIAVVATSLFVRPITDYLVIRIIKSNIITIAKLILLPLLNTLIVILMIVVSKLYLFETETYIYFFVLVLNSLIFYIGGGVILDKLFDYGLGKHLKKVYLEGFSKILK